MKNRTAALFLAILLAVPAIARADDDDAVRQQFRDAMTSARAGQTPAQPDSAALRDYVLYPYLEATRIQSLISRGIDGSADAAAARWLNAHPDLPVSRELRRQWLRDIAARGDWPLFTAQDDGSDSDPTLVCYRWQARIASDGDPAATGQALLAFWVDAPQMPAVCNPPFDWLQAQNLIGDAAVEQRARKALSAGNSYLAGVLIQRLPPERAAPLRQWQRLLDDPQQALSAIVGDPRQRFEWTAFDAGFQKLARRDPPTAQTLLKQFDRSRIDDAQYGELCRAVALGLAWDRDPGAIAAFQAVPEDAVDDTVREWRVRAALWNGDWQLAANWLQTLPASAADDPRWAYWRARSAEQLGQNDQARALYSSLAQSNGYYGVLSAWRLGARYQPQTRDLDADHAAQKRLLKRNDALLRARELYFVDEVPWADSEWRTATATMTDADRLQAALLASHWGWHWQAVLMLTRLDDSDALDLMYPKKAYADEIRNAAKQSDLPPAWIYGVMRQESLFLRQAVSSSDALGLLQLKLATARDAARRAGLPRPDRDDLFDARTNIALGSAYLRQMTDRYGGQFVLTVASYNAGPNAVARWLPDTPLDADIWIENVPYNETRKYVERIAWHIAVHDWQTSGKIRDFDDLLQPVHRVTP
ncbi:lytic transglycosylase domain-containing protein [Solimonas terrae]|uniref:Lytic transglycosylase domain-containing protein n=1 Tax=Solimonas terrae TaxID=1396819 RepID=A0A6M2BQ74_9GAMM|nr:lytic transglycosylase domain-containing protein [Solimonas terrae]NGY04762.1 lytic transglycosylase domain-containing protein [Solimonas terrae]